MYLNNAAILAGRLGSLLPPYQVQEDLSQRVLQRIQTEGISIQRRAPRLWYWGRWAIAASILITVVVLMLLMQVQPQRTHCSVVKGEVFKLSAKDKDWVEFSEAKGKQYFPDLPSRAAKDKDWVALSEGSFLVEGDSVRTTRTASCKLELPDGSYVTLQGGTLIRLDQLDPFEGISISLDRGQISAEVPAKTRSYYIYTPSAQVSALGTRLTVRLQRLMVQDQVEALTTVSAKDGEVLVQSRVDKKILRQGETVQTTALSRIEQIKPDLWPEIEERLATRASLMFMPENPTLKEQIQHLCQQVGFRVGFEETLGERLDRRTKKDPELLKKTMPFVEQLVDLLDGSDLDFLIKDGRVQIVSRDIRRLAQREMRPLGWSRKVDAYQVEPGRLLSALKDDALWIRLGALKVLLKIGREAWDKVGDRLREIALDETQPIDLRVHILAHIDLDQMLFSRTLKLMGSDRITLNQKRALFVNLHRHRDRLDRARLEKIIEGLCQRDLLFGLYVWEITGDKRYIKDVKLFDASDDAKVYIIAKSQRLCRDIQMLRMLLMDEDSSVRLAVLKQLPAPGIFELSERAMKELIEMLYQLIEHDPCMDVRRKALCMLIYLFWGGGGPYSYTPEEPGKTAFICDAHLKTAQELVLRLYNSRDFIYRRILLAPESAPLWATKEGITLLKGIIQCEQDIRLRLQAAIILEYLFHQKRIPEDLGRHEHTYGSSLLETQDTFLLLRALRFLAVGNSIDYLDIYIRMKGSSRRERIYEFEYVDPSRRRNQIWFVRGLERSGRLGLLEDQKVRKRLFELLDHPHPMVRYYSILLLGCTRYKPAQKRIGFRLTSPIKQESWAARFALSMLQR
jgi:ferric-dicitrate binding protein FerR (iron transport regulator)